MDIQSISLKHAIVERLSQVIDPETSGHTTTCPAIFGTFCTAISIASCSASTISRGISRFMFCAVTINWYGNARALAMACGSRSSAATYSTFRATPKTP